MTGKSVQRVTRFTAEERARNKQVRERFDRDKPSLEDLVGSGEYNQPVLNGQFLALQRLLFLLKKAREKNGQSLTDIARQTGLGKAALSRLENGQKINPT